MIDFTNKAVFKLKQVSNDNFAKMVAPLLVQNEQILLSYQALRDGVVFTNL